MKKTKVVRFCIFTGYQADYRVGLVKYNKKKLFRDLGAVVKEKVLHAIENIQSNCFGTSFWVVIMDLNGSIIYRTDEADKHKISAKEGWRQYLIQQKQ